MGTTTTFRDATRLMGGATVQLERRLLLWLAPRLPRRINSDHLTALGFIAMGLAGASYWLSGTHPWALWMVNVWLAVNWFGDSLDGTLARVRQHQRPRYGFYVDHVLDAAGALMLIGGLALSGYVSPILALGLIVAYFLVVIEVYLATYCLGTFRMSFMKVGGTELRLLLVAANTAVALLHPGTTAVVLGHSVRLFDPGAVIAIAALLAAFVISTVQNTRALYKAEPITSDRAPVGRDR